MMENEDICFSGGAIGADTLFGKCAKEHHHKVVHYSFEGHKIKWPYKEDIVTLTKEQLLEADEHVLEADSWLKRGFPYPRASEYVNNLLRRNYWQIKETERIYAISEIGERHTVKGGTGWAVMMGMLRDQIRSPPIIYVFDQKINEWLMWLNPNKYFPYGRWEPYGTIPPFPYGKYTGIGTRYLTKNGERAIKELYGIP